jgi:translation initiation factor IF-1
MTLNKALHHDREGLALPDSLLPDAKEQSAVVRAHQQGLFFLVQLLNGSEVVARVPKRTARVMFRIVPGDRVRVIERLPGEFRVLGFDRA